MTWNTDDALPDLEVLSVPELIQLYRRTLYELHDREVVQTLDNLTGGLAELLVSIAYGGELAPNSQKGYDVLAGREQLQVKARALPYPDVGSNTTGTVGPGHYDKMIVVLFNPADLSVAIASELTPAVVEAKKTRKNRLTPNRVLMEELGMPITERLQAAARELYNWPDVGQVHL